LFDTQGVKYLDFICGLGAISLGYSNQRVCEAVIRQASRGASHSLPTTLEVEVAERISSIFQDAERIRFFKNGDDATRAAVRIARTYTNRTLVLSDGYHGCSDLWTSLTEPALGVKDKFDIRPLNGLEGEITQLKPAAVIVEALKLSDGADYQEYLTKIRAECKKAGTLFIMDEIVTGCRVPKWSISNAWDLRPDLICLGKGIANGWPLSAIGGHKDIMNCGEYFLSTTFGGEATSLAACMATLTELERRSFTDLIFYGKRLLKNLNELIPEVKWEGWGSRAQLNLEEEKSCLFIQEMCKAGFLFGRAFFYNFAHLESNIDQLVMNLAEKTATAIKAGKVKLEGERPSFSFKR